MRNIKLKFYAVNSALTIPGFVIMALLAGGKNGLLNVQLIDSSRRGIFSKAVRVWLLTALAAGAFYMALMLGRRWYGI